MLKDARDWKLQVDLPGSHLCFPEHIAATLQRPDIILTSNALKRLIIIELTVPSEHRVEVSSELKRVKYEDGVASAAENKGRKTTIYAVEMGCRGFPAYSMVRLLKELGYQGKKKKEILRKLRSITEEASLYIWKTSQYKTWSRDA